MPLICICHCYCWSLTSYRCLLTCPPVMPQLQANLTSNCLRSPHIACPWGHLIYLFFCFCLVYQVAYLGVEVGEDHLRSYPTFYDPQWDVRFPHEPRGISHSYKSHHNISQHFLIKHWVQLQHAYTVYLKSATLCKHNFVYSNSLHGQFLCP